MVSSPFLASIIAQVRVKGIIGNYRFISIPHLSPEIYAHIQLTNGHLQVCLTWELKLTSHIAQSETIPHPRPMSLSCLREGHCCLLCQSQEPECHPQLSLLTNSSHSNSCGFCLLNISWLYPHLNATHLHASNLGHSYPASPR